MMAGGTFDAAGAWRNGVLWAAGWSAVVLLAFAVMWLAGRVHPAVTLEAVMSLACRFALWGALAGAFFWALLAALERWKHPWPIADISSARFGILGAVATAAFVPVTLQAFNMVSGDGLVPWGKVLDDVFWALPLGGVAAVATLKLAQRRARRAA